jgi:hypothetical protein
MKYLICPERGLSTAVGHILRENPEIPEEVIQSNVLKMAVRRHEVSRIREGSDVEVCVLDGDICSLTVYVARIRRYVEEWCTPRPRLKRRGP